MDSDEVDSSTSGVIETRVGRIWLGADGILRGDSVRGVVMTLADVEEITRVSRELVGERPIASLVDISGVRSITPEARRAFADPELNQRTIALALVIRSPVSKVIGNIFLALNRPACPVKLFTSEAPALSWLKEHLTLRAD